MSESDIPSSTSSPAEPIIEMSDAIDAIAKVLPKAQSAMGDVIKKATNPAFRSKYADLGAVVEAVIPALNEHGISLLQPPAYDPGDGTVRVATMLLHESGQWLRCTLALPLAKRDPQGVGSAVTYGRRYGLQAMSGVAPEDDDGNAASAQSVRPERAPQDVRPITPEPEGPDWPGCEASGPGRTSHACKQDGTDLVFKALRKELSELESMVAVNAFIQENGPKIAPMPRAWRKVLAAELGEVEQVIRNSEAA